MLQYFKITFYKIELYGTDDYAIALCRKIDMLRQKPIPR